MSELKNIEQKKQLEFFLKKIMKYSFFCAIFIIFFTIALAFIAYPYNIKMGRASYIDKQNRLINTSSPKIIIIGGSNANYGLYSKILEDSLKRPVVNISLNAEVGLEFMFNMVNGFIKKDDWVVVMPEYKFFDSNFDQSNNLTVYQIVSCFPESIKYLTKKQLVNSIFFLNKLNSTNIESIGYLVRNRKPKNRYNYNIYGDYEGHKFSSDTTTTLKEYDKNYSKPNIQFNTLNKNTLSAFNMLKNNCEKNGAELLISFPVYLNSLIDETLPQLMKENLRDFNWISDYKTYAYDTSYLYDTPYHLKFKFRNERSLKLVKDIQAYLSNNSKP
jgi:hypothetical protein